VPIIVNGVDISYAVVEGDFGLGKGIRMQPTVYGGRSVEGEPNVGHYYPTLGLGAKPGYGRLEIEPPSDRKLPKPAESFHQFWGAASEQLPAQSTPAEIPYYLSQGAALPRGSEDHARRNPRNPSSRNSQNPVQQFQSRP
jgi:hypothetical protein